MRDWSPGRWSPRHWSPGGRVLAAVLAQLALAFGLLIPAAVDRVGAQEVTLITEPVDPRDLLRGQYLTLGYAVSRVTAGPDVRERGYAYVPLTRQGGVWTGTRAQARRPASGMFLRGRVAYNFSGRALLTYGLERYYVSEGAARAEQGRSVQGLRARILVSPSGRARLLGLSRAGVEIR